MVRVLVNVFSTAPYSSRTLEIEVQKTESRYPPQHHREDEHGMPPCFSRVLQRIRRGNENLHRARGLSRQTEENSNHTSDVANSVVHDVGDARGNALVLLLQTVIVQN